MKSENRRNFHRVNLDERVDLGFIEDNYNGCQIKNLSLGGMFVLGSFSQTQMENRQIDIFIKTKSERTRLHASATVVWGNEEGVGLKFTSMTKDNYMSLLTTLINNAERPAIIQYEFLKSCPFEIKHE